MPYSCGMEKRHSGSTDRRKQQKLDRLRGDLRAPRRPLTDFESLYEVANDGALFSVRLQRFLKPVINPEHGNAELEFEHQDVRQRISPGKAVALSFFLPAQRARIADEAYEEQSFHDYDGLKGHPAIARLAYKYDVLEGAIFYILMSSLSERH